MRGFFAALRMTNCIPLNGPGKILWDLVRPDLFVWSVRLAPVYDEQGKSIVHDLKLQKEDLVRARQSNRHAFFSKNVSTSSMDWVWR